MYDLCWGKKTNWLKMNAQEEQKITIKISFMTAVFSGEPEGFGLPSGDS